jgi:Uri superfamily endonuclease
MSKKTKFKNVLDKAKEAISTGKYIYIGHAQDRLQERLITRLEVKQIIKNGHH